MLVLPTADRYLAFAPKGTIAETDTAPLPAVSADPATWGRWFNALRRGYLDRRYNLRGLLISWNSYMDTFVLASTTPSSKVMAGREPPVMLAVSEESSLPYQTAPTRLPE